MEIAQVLAGFSLGQADNLRRAMGKKKKSELDKQYAGFQAGMLERGYSQKAITTLWEILLPFSDYAFNKAHSAAYGVISYWTAYLKANYPAEYMAALLTSTRVDKDKSAIYLNECRRMGIKVLPPDVNESVSNFASVGADIRFGLGAIRNIGENVVAGIVEGRGPGRLHRLQRLPRQGADAGVQQAGPRLADQGRGVRLARSPAPRADDGRRGGRRPLHRPQAPGRDRPGLAVRRSWTTLHRLARSRCPNDAGVGEDAAAGLRARHARPLRVRPPAAGPRARAARQQRLHGRRAARPTPSCPTAARAHLRPHHRRAATHEQEGRQLGLGHDRGPRGRHRGHGASRAPTSSRCRCWCPTRSSWSRAGCGARTTASSSTPRGHDAGDAARAAPDRPLVVSLAASRCTRDTIGTFKQVLSAHPGMSEVHLRLIGNGTTTTMRLDDSLRVATSSSLIADLKELLGPHCLT